MNKHANFIWLYTIGQPARKIQLGHNVIASGADGAIYRIRKHPELVAKIYHKAGSDPQRLDKIKAMLAAPPNIPSLEIEDTQYVQLA